MKLHPLIASRLAGLALLLVTMIWGTSFFLTKDLLSEFSPELFLAVRFIICSLVMLAFFGHRLLRAERRVWKNGLVLGGVYGLAQIAQTWGLVEGSASNIGFLTGLSVVVAPIIVGLILRERIPYSIWLACLTAALGLGLLSIGPDFTLAPGDAWAIAGAMGYGLHIVLLSRYSRPDDVINLVTLQMLMVALVASLGAIGQDWHLPASPGSWMQMLYLALGGGILCIGLQAWAQSYISAPRAAVILSMEPVFAAFFAIWLGGESFTWRLALGGSSILFAMLIAQLAPSLRPPGPRNLPPSDTLPG